MQYGSNGQINQISFPSYFPGFNIFRQIFDSPGEVGVFFILTQALFFKYTI